MVAHNGLAFYLDKEDYFQKPLKISDTALAKFVAKDVENIEIDLFKPV